MIRFFTFSRYKKYLPFLYSHILSASAIAREKLDVYHSPANVVPLRYNGKFAVTIHDLAIYREPKAFPSRQGFSIKYLVPRSINKATKIIAVSESTKKDVTEFFKVDPATIDVIYEGVENGRFSPKRRGDTAAMEKLKRRYGIRGDYVLFVGTLEPRKNLIRLLEACFQLYGRRSDLAKKFQMVLAGQRGWLYDEIFEEVKNRGLSGNVVFPGYVPAADMPKLYTGATVFIYPSLYEGFGLPVLEAMASGVAVISSNVSSIPEITGDAALLVDPLDTEGMSEALEKLLTDENYRKKLAERGLKRAEEFSWEKCARQTLEVYRAVKG